MEWGTITFLFVGLLLGGLLGWVLARLKQKSRSSEEGELKLQLKLESERGIKLNEELVTLNEMLKQERREVMNLHGENVGLKAEYKNLKERLDGNNEDLKRLQEQFAHQFKNLAQQIFEEKSQKFTEQNKVNLDHLLKPLGDKLQAFEQKVEASNRDSLRNSTALREQILSLKELNQRMTQEAEHLAKALKGDVKTQGNWGEMILERILEKSGLTKGQEYFTQETHQGEQGQRLRPDVIIRLPENKNLIIDAKVSLVAFDRYMNEEDEEVQSHHLKEYLLSVRAHVKGLSDKNYHQLFDGGNLDYVLMFVPIESAFSMIVQSGGDLYNLAQDSNIIIVSPATLIATLRTVASIWKHEYQNRNAQEIARQGGALYDKFSAFVENLVEVGKSLDKSKSVYKEAMNKLVEGKDNLIRKTERLKELGAKTKKDMDHKMLDRAGARNIDEEADQNMLF